MILRAYTIFHTALSLIAICTGLLAVFGLIARKLLPGWTKWFLLTAVATTVTGFFFPFHGVTPAFILGIVSCVVLAPTLYAYYSKHLLGTWRPIYVIGAFLSLYFNIFVAITQSFEKIPALHALAPTQKELPFAIAQLTTLTIFVILTIVGAIRFRAPPGLSRE